MNSPLPHSSLSTPGGAIWDLSISTSSDSETTALLIACEDGTAKLFKTSEDERRIYLENSTRNYDNVRCLCVQWLNGEKGDLGFVAGF